MILRDAKKEDINSIVKLGEGLIDFHRKLDSYYKQGKEGKEDFRKFLLKKISRKNSKVLIAKDKKRVLAFFIGFIQKPMLYAIPQRIGWISDAYVLPQYRRKDIAKKMLNELMGWFKKNKIENVELCVDSRNKIAIMVYKNYGFFEYMKKMRMDL